MGNDVFLLLGGGVKLNLLVGTGVVLLLGIADRERKSLT